MRTTIIRGSTFAAIFILPLLLTPTRDSSGFASSFDTSTAIADGTFLRLFRWTGFGWSCGYHTWNNNSWGLSDGLPPVGNAALRHESVVAGRFQWVEPVHPAVHPAGYVFQGHRQGTFVQQGHVDAAPWQSEPPGNLGDSLAIAQQTQSDGSCKPYRSAIPPKSPKKPAVGSEQGGVATPSD